MASTFLHEHGYNTNLIKMQLAYKNIDAVREAYNHAKHLAKNTEIMQTWADYLDELRNKKELYGRTISVQKEGLYI